MPRGGSPPAPSAGKSATRTAQKTALCAPCEHPGGFGIRKSASNSGHSPLRGLGVGLGDDQGTDRPMAALYFLLPTGDSRSGRRSLIPNSSPFSRSTRFPFTSTPSPPAPLAIRKAPSASVESIQPRPPRPCEVGRPKGRRRKTRRQSHRFFLAPAAPWRPPREGGHPAGLGAPPSTRQIKGGKVMKTFWLLWMPDVPESAGRPRNAREISWQACCDCVADVRKRVKSTSCRPAFNGDNAPPAHFVHYDSSWRL